jgi:hypothetical protein
LSRNRVGDERNDLANLLPTRFYNAQQCRDEVAASGDLRSKRRLAPDRRVSQGTLTRVVRRLDIFIIQKRAQGFNPVQNVLKHAGQLAMQSQRFRF